MKLVIALVAATLNAAVATIPSAVDIAMALQHAKQAWGVESPWPIEMRLEPINACDSRTRHDVATTQVTERWSQIIDEHGVPAGERSYSYTVLILLNSSCNWSKLDLNAVLEHEYGHVLLGAGYHSKDRRSIMFEIVGGKQEIMPADRNLLKAGSL